MLDTIDRFSKSRWSYIVLFLAAFATRAIGAYMGGSGGNRGDDDGMLLGIAQNYLAGRGFMMYWQGLGPNYCFLPPGFPVFHIVFIKLFKDYWTAERIFFVLMSSITNVFFFFLARKYFSDRVAWIAAILLVLYPPQWFWSTRINSHAYATDMFVISLYVLLVSWEKKSIVFGFLAGVLWASLSLMRPEYLLGIFCLALGSFFRLRKEKIGKTFVTMLVVGWVITLSPWVVRNYLKVGKLVLSSTHYSYNFWLVFNPAYKYGGNTFETPPDLQAELEHASETERVNIWLHEGMRFIHEHPRDAFHHALLNLLNFWRPWLSFSSVSLFENAVYMVFWIPIFILFLIGLKKLPYGEPRWTIIWTFLLYKTLAQIPFYVIVRFREAIVPLFFLIAMVPVSVWLEKVDDKIC